MSELHKFLFEGLPVRGMLVRLTDSWQRGAAPPRRRAARYPPPVRALLGEMAAAGVLMQANIKFNGALILQIFGDGPVKLAVAEVQPDLAFRATAKVVGEVADDARLAAMLNVHGKGRCAITLDPQDSLPGQQPYQGVVPLHGDRASRCRQSARCWSTTCCSPSSSTPGWCWPPTTRSRPGLLIQRLPVEGEGNLERAGAARTRSA